MATTEEVKLIIKAATEQAVANIDKLNASMENSNKAGLNLGKIAGNLKSQWMSTTVIIGSAAAAFYKFAKAGMESEEAELRLAAAMKNSNVYSVERLEHLTTYASELQKVTTYEDEEIMSVQKLYTQYGLQGQALDDLTKATLDFASAKGMDLASAADLVGKAINGSTDSVRGLTVNLKDMTSKSEKANAIAKEMTQIFGGDAAAAADTAAGRFEQAQIALGDLAETIGSAALPAIKIISEVVKGAAEWFDGLSMSNKNLIIAAGAVGIAIAVLTKIVMVFGVTLSAAIWPVTLIVAAIVAAIVIVKNWETVVWALRVAWEAVKFGFDVVVQSLKVGMAAINVAMSKAIEFIATPFVNAINIVIEGLNKLPGVHLEKMNNIFIQQSEHDQLMLEQELAKLAALEMADVEHKTKKEEQETAHQDKMNGLIKSGEDKRAGEIKKNIMDIALAKDKAMKEQLQKEIDYKKLSSQIDLELVNLYVQNRGLNVKSAADTWSFIMNGLDKDSKAQFKIWKGMAIANAAVATYQAAINAYNAMAGIPYVGPVLGAAAAAVAAGFGVLQINKIKNTQFQGAEEGALIRGAPGNAGRLIRAGENGKDEAIIPLEDSGVMDRLGGGTTVNIYNETAIMDDDYPQAVAIKIDNALYKLQQQGLRKS
jgi:hypothetical protein